MKTKRLKINYILSSEIANLEFYDLHGWITELIIHIHYCVNILNSFSKSASISLCSLH